MSNESIIDAPNDFRTFVMALRTIHWITIIMRNRGIPKAIVEKMQQAEGELETQAKSSPLYDTMYEAICGLIDTYHRNEPQPSNEDPDHIWARERTKVETYTTLTASLTAIKGAVAALTGLAAEAYPLEQLQEAMQLLTEWLERVSRDTSDSRLQAAADGEDIQ